MNTINVLLLASLLFLLGFLGILIRKNILVLMMCIELMLNAANLLLIHFSTQLEDAAGQMAVFFVITVAAAEAAIGLGLLIALFRNIKSVSTENIQLLKE